MKWFWLACVCVLVRAEPPEVFITSPSCDSVSFVGSQVLLLAFSLDADLTYTWTVSDGQVLQGSNVLVALDGPGIHQVSLVATNSAGESSAPQTRLIYLTDPTFFTTQPKLLALNPSASVVGPGTVVQIQPIITDADQDGPYRYYWCWTKDDEVFRAETPVLETSFDLKEGETSRTYSVSLFVVDQAGNASFAKQINIFVSNGNLPPSARIVAPATSIIEVQAGTTVSFRAEATDQEGDLPIVYRWIMPDGSFANESTAAFRFEEEGFFVVALVVADSLGNETPTPLSVLVNVSAAVNPEIPKTFILLPSVSTRIFAGESLILSGTIATSNPELKGFWTATDLATNALFARVEGNQPGRLKFPHSGLFLIRFGLNLFDQENQSSFANTRLIAVHDRDNNEAPVLSYGQDAVLQSVRNGVVYNLSVEGSDPDGEAIEIIWMLEGALQENQGSNINFTANLPASAFSSGVAYQTVRVTATDSSGKSARQPLIFSVAIYADRKPPEPSINNLTLGEVVFVPFNEPYPIISSVTDDPGVPLIYRWIISYIDDLTNPLFSGTTDGTLAPLVLERPGVISISLFIETADGLLANAFGHTHYVYAFDPLALPTATITKPKADEIVVEVGDRLIFEGLISDPNLFVGPQDTFGFIQASTSMVWDISRDGVSIQTVTMNEPLSVSFDQAGIYEIALSAQNSLGLVSAQADKVQVRVIEQRSDASLEPNNSRETAASLTVGNYGGLSVDVNDPVDWYQFDFMLAGAAIEFQFDLRDTIDDAVVAIFQEDELIASRRLAAGSRHPFTFVGGKAGRYYLELRILGSNIGKRAVVFGFSVSVSNPRLVFSYPKTDAVDQTFLTLVNPTQGQARATLIARNKLGVALAESEMALPPNGHMEKDIESLFPNLNPLDLAWVQVRSDQNILGLSTTLSRDELAAVAEPAIIGSLDELVIPHIAQDTDTWFTQASVVNHSGEMVDARFRSSAGEFPIANLADVHQRTLIDFEQFFGGELPMGSEWGRLQEVNGQPGLVGLEIFGTKNGSPRIAALNLSSDKLRNPNFTYINNNLYFPHIAEDRANFFTGVAFVNMAPEPVDIVLIGYNRQGQELARVQRQLMGLEKVVDLAENLFAGLPTESRLSWLELKTSGPVQGYTIFGDNRGNNALLAGLTAISGGTKEVIFQKILYEPGRYWTGLAVVNVSEEAQANLTYRGYDSQGNLLATANSQIAPHQKDLNLIENLFDGELVGDIRWVKLTSDQPLAAFELFGDLAGNFLAGCVAQ